MSRIGKQPIPIPSGVDVTIDGRHVAVKGPKGTLEHDVPETITVARDGDDLVVTRPDDERDEPRAARAHALAGHQHGHRRVGGLHPRARDRRRRLPRPRAGPDEARAPARVLAPGARRRPRRHHVRGAGSRPASRCRASTSSWSARSRPTSARSASPSPTRARASATPTSACCARPASRRSDAPTRKIREVGDDTPQGRRSQAAPPPGAQEGARHRRRARASRCSARTSTSTRRSSTTSRARRSRRRRRWRRASPAAAPRSTPRRRSGQRVGERAKAAGIDDRRVRPRRIQVPRSGRWRRRRRPRRGPRVLESQKKSRWQKVSSKSG